MDEVVLGMVGIVVGTLVAAFGARGFFILLPLWGAVAGFLLGAEIASELLGEGLLATVAGWALAIGMGAVFAVLAGVFWYMAVVILAGSVGFGIGTGLLVAIGVEPGLLTGLVGAVVAVVLIVLAILIDAPTLYIAVLSAFGGAAVAVAGAWLLLGEIEIADLDSRGPLGALRDQPVALIAWAGLGALALGYQWLEMRRMAAERTAKRAA